MKWPKNQNYQTFVNAQLVCTSLLGRERGVYLYDYIKYGWQVASIPQLYNQDKYLQSYLMKRMGGRGQKCNEHMGDVYKWQVTQHECG